MISTTSLSGLRNTALPIHQFIHSFIQYLPMSYTGWEAKVVDKLMHEVLPSPYTMDNKVSLTSLSV